MPPKKNFYAVKKGRKTGIFTSWEQCKAQVEGFSGASYKGFVTKDEAEAFMSGCTEGCKTPDGTEAGFAPNLGCAAAAYVDGSYHAEKNQFSYGLVFFHNGGEQHFYQAFDDPSLADMRNVAGEIKGAQKAMEMCIDNKIDSIIIFYDYEGIEKWCTGEWKTNKDGTKAYKAYYDSVKDKLAVTFCKVAAHSGDKYNDLADALAKKALGIENPYSWIEMFGF